MNKVKCEVEYTTDYNDDGYEVDSVLVTCKKCGYQVSSFGDGLNSINRCLALLNEECENYENNFYVVD